MTKELKCGDLIPGCDYRARGETEEEVLADAAEHVQREHGINATPELVGKARMAIRDE